MGILEVRLYFIRKGAICLQILFNKAKCGDVHKENHTECMPHGKTLLGMLLEAGVTSDFVEFFIFS